MDSRLAYTDPYGEIRHFPIDGAEIIIGRDPSCGVTIDSDDISRQHATIRFIDGNHFLTDLGSTNGSTVNQVYAVNPIMLRPGDLIELAGVIQLVYETGPRPGNQASRGMLIGAVTALAVVLVGIGLYVFLPPKEVENPGLQKAVKLAREGVVAARAGEQSKAGDLLRSAAGELYTAGYLDDVPRGDLQREAMRMIQGELNVSFDLWSFYDNVLRQPNLPTPVAVVPERKCRLDEVPAEQLEQCLRFWIDYVMIEIHQETDTIPSHFHKKVGARLRIENAFIRRSIVRGEKLVPMLRRELEASKMPPLLHYVALIESGYRNAATSTVAAAGIWQFMPATGRQYGLRVNKNMDERRDPEKATRAATRYLRDLAFEFGGDALLLALAGYNRGENGVRRSLKRLEDPFSDRSYWRLVERDLLPDETQTYVPRFIAAAVAGEGGVPEVETLEQAGY